MSNKPQLVIKCTHPELVLYCAKRVNGNCTPEQHKACQGR